MKELVFDLITSYENRISVVEQWITTAYQAVAASKDGFGALEEERERLKASLQEMLARNCSLRRKDFSHLMQTVLADSEQKRGEIEEERNLVIERIKAYLDEQKELAISLRQRLVELVTEKAEQDSLRTVMNGIKTGYHDIGQQLFTLLRDFQSHLGAFHREQEEINRKLQRLVDRGELLKIEDLRQLEAAEAHFKQYRESGRERRQ